MPSTSTCAAGICSSVCAVGITVDRCAITFFYDRFNFWILYQAQLSCQSTFNFLRQLMPMFCGSWFEIAQRNDDFVAWTAFYDCAGAVSLHPLEDPAEPREWHDVKCLELADSDLAEHIRQLPRQPLMAGVAGIRLSLAGAHDKAAVCMTNNRVALPLEGTPTSHILKPAIKGLEEITANEFFTMRLARQMGLTAAPVEMREVDGITFLLVARYDRMITDNGEQIKRIHQEDFCQAMGIRAASKYQSMGGPGLKNCFQLLTKTNRPALDRNLFAEAIVFNFLVGNRDSHAKNFALLHAESLRFAPLYDLVSTAIYTELDSNPAMSIGGKYNPADVLPRHWQRMCEEAKYSYPAMRKMLFEWSEKLPMAARTVKTQLEQELRKEIPVGDRIVSFIESSCATLSKRFASAS